MSNMRPGSGNSYRGTSLHQIQQEEKKQEEKKPAESIVKTNTSKLVKIIPSCWITKEGFEFPLDAKHYFVNVDNISVIELDENEDGIFNKAAHIHLVNGDVIFITNYSVDAVFAAMGMKP